VSGLYERVESPALTVRQQTLVEFADKLTKSPETFTPADTETLREVLRHEEEVLEAVNVVAGFNFANRVADALDVSQEIPAVLLRTRTTMRAALRLWAWAVRRRMNFVNRTPSAPPPDEVLVRLAAATREAGLGSVPSYFELLRPRPHILAGQATICTNLFATVRLPRPTILRIGYLVSSVTGDREMAREFERVAEESGTSLEPAQLAAQAEDATGAVSPLEAKTLAFAYVMTRHAYRITDDQVESLKCDGYDDVQVLDLVLLTAAFNAGTRLNRALAGTTA
jgi:alkylhydroperoxidase family enzyme